MYNWMQMDKQYNLIHKNNKIKKNNKKRKKKKKKVVRMKIGNLGFLKKKYLLQN